MADLKPFTGELDAPTSLKPFDGQLDGEKAKPAGAMRKLGDLGLGFASGAVGATKALADVAGADNKASRVLSDINTGINDYLSPAAKADQQEQGAIMAGAAGKGTWEGIKAGAKAFGVAPVQTAVQGLGSVVPILAGTALTGGVAPAAAVGTGIGVAMGAGTAKGSIFEEVKKRGIAKGLTDAQATAEADRAQEYGGANTDQIALGGALGAADALTGVSAAASRMARNALGKPVAQALTNTAERGVVARAGMGMLKEMPLEAAQGGQEQVAANVAAQRAGYEAGTFDNVASNATLEALASAGPGAAFGALDTQTKQTPPPVVPPAVPPAIDQLSGLTTAPAAPQADPATPTTPGMGFNPDAGQMTQFPDGSQSFASEVPPVKPSEAMGINPTAGPISAAAALSVDSGVTQEIQVNEASAADQAAYEQATQAQAQQAAEQDTADKPITTGKLAEAQLSEDDKRAILFSNKAVADGGIQYEGTQDGDILNGQGQPYGTRFAAARRARMEGKDWTIATVFDGYVARRKDAFDDKSATPAGLDNQATTESGNQPIGSREPAMGAVPAGSGNDGDTATPGATTVASDSVLDAGSGTSAVANQPLAKTDQAPIATENVALAPITQPAQPGLPGEGAGVSQPTQVAPTLPKDLAKANPRYAYKDKQFTLSFANDFDRAAYIVAQDKPSKRDGDYRSFGMGVHGLSAEQLIAHGKAVRDYIKSQAKNSTAGNLDIPSLYKPTESTNAKTSEAKQEKPQQPAQEVTKDQTNGTDKRTEQQPAGSEETGQASTQGTKTSQEVTRKLLPAQAQKLQEAHKAHGASVTFGTVQKMYDQVMKSLITGKGNNGGVEFNITPRVRKELQAKADRLINDLSLFGVESRETQAPAVAAKPVTPQSPPAADDSFEPIGAKAFANGQPRVLPKSLQGTTTIAKEWYRGWDAANAAAPVSKTETTAPTAATQSTSPAVQDFIDGKRDDAPSMEEVNAESEPYLSEAKALLEAQKKSTGNAVAEAKVRKQIRELAGKVQDGSKAALALDIAATRLGMGEGRLKGLEYAAPVSNMQTADAPAPEIGADGQQDELDAEMQSYEAKANPTYSGEIKNGDFGPILTQFKGDAQGAIKALTKLQGGEAVAALNHPEVGDIDLVWGKEGTKESNGSGLAKLVKWHPEVVGNLQEVISSLKVVGRTENRIQLESDTHKAAVRLEWNGVAKKWLLTAFEKRVVGSGTRTDTTANGVGDDTARPKSDNTILAPSTPEVKANTVFTEDAAAAARARLKAKLNRLNSGIDPEMLMDGIILSGYHIEKGARTFAAYARAMIEDLGDGVKPYLKSWYMASKYDPRMAGMDGLDDAATMDAVNLDSLEVPVEKTGESLTESLTAAILSNNMPKDNPALKKLVEAFDGKPADTARMKEAQEALEAAIVNVSRGVVAKNEGTRTTFDVLLRLYQSQPNLNIRTSTSIANQAYSTPAPLAYLGSVLADVTPKTSMYEPTGGNGMLTINALPANVTVNELEPGRIAALKAQGFKQVLEGDAVKADVPPKSQDRVMTNPPFGSIKDAKGEATKILVDGYRIGQIDHLIAARALETMKDDGKATLIIGANKVTGGLNTDDRIFFNWLYGNYNVTSHFELDGDLYNRQGAGWPVRVITVHGRQKSDRVSPVAGTIQRAQNWEQVYEHFTASLDSSRTESRPSQGGSTGSKSTGQTGLQPIQKPAGKSDSKDGGRGQAGSQTADAGLLPANSDGSANGGLGGEPGGVQRLNGDDIGSNRLDPAGDAVITAPAKSLGNPGATALSSAENQFQVTYEPRSSRKDGGVLIPVNMKDPTQDALSRLEDAVGNIDDYLTQQLGYESVEKLHDALMGLQVDSVASAIYQIEQGKGVVIADQTGIGKGRQAAAVIRWAERSGYIPVFVSVKPSLFTDMFGDLHDIGSDNIAPFILNKDESIKGPGDEKLFANKSLTHKRTIENIRDNGALPAGSNAIFMTYSQVNTDNVQRQMLTALADRAVFILDESHNAGGQSNTGEFITSLLEGAKGVTYLSATYAKRPDNMPLYFKTDIGQAAADNEGLMQAMANGGLPLQTVVSNNLVKAGQMFRRERSYDGVSIETISDTEHRVEHEKLSDETTKALRAIVDADRMFHHVFVKQMNDDAKNLGAAVIDNAGNKAQAGVDHTQFSSVVHNFVKQMLLGLKAQRAADDAIKALKNNEKPIIAVENTMGSFLEAYAKDNSVIQGGSLGSFDYRTVLSRALARTLFITEVKPNGDKVKKEIKLSELDPETRAAYDNAQRVIDGLKLDIPVSPIDWMRNEIRKAGFTVAEITGRKLAVDYSVPGKATLGSIDSLEQSDKVRTTQMFNSGRTDALILNVAGSTGISLHASEKFQDQRQRHMIIGQAAGDINIFMQMLGRVHRTGQVVLPKYTILSVDLPTEKRPTAVLSGKMKSLNANTSSNTDSATSIKTVDMFNKYGDKVVSEYLKDNYALARALGVEDIIGGDDASEDLAQKATGRLALQPISVQNSFYDEVEGQYAAMMEYLNKTNQNDLEPRTFDYDAQETRSEVLFDGPDKESPFGEDAIYGEYSIKAQGKAMTPAEIREAMNGNLEGKTPDLHMRATLAPLVKQFEDYIATLEGPARDSANATRAAGQAFMVNHSIGDTFRVDINGDSFNAVVTNIRNTHKVNGNPFSLSKIQVTIALNGALRSISVPASQLQKIEVSAIGRGYTVEQLFKEQPANQRETAKIVTGNLLAAYGELQGVRGTIITFTKQDGTTEQGILLPKAFDYSRNTRGDYRLATGADALNFLQKSENKDIGRFGIQSRDGIVRVLPAGQGIAVMVPKSKLKGGKFFLDTGLIEVLGDFVTSGSAMKATTYDQGDAIKALDLLMKKNALYAIPSMAEEAKALSSPTSINPAAFSRTKAPARGLPTSQVTSIVDAIKASWGSAPDIVVASSMEDAAIPQAVRDHDKTQRSLGAKGNPEGFFYGGKVYLIADQLGSISDVARVLFHETLGHAGLRGVFGDSLNGILNQIVNMRRADVAAKAKQYGLDMSKPAEALQAAEEVLAEMAQNKPEMGFVKRAIAAIRQFLRGLGMNFKLTDADIVANYILPARGFVENGKQKGAITKGALAFSLKKTDALQKFSEADDLFSLPKSKSNDLQQIARDNGAEVTVRTTDLAGEKLHTLTFKNGIEIRISDRKANPYGQGQQVYAFDLVDGTAVPTQIGRPGENPEDVDPTDDVWLDVSNNIPAKYGAIAYNIASTYAFNNGKIFVGDPAGLSDAALRRRTEQMISSALKFGTTEHLAPHPRQIMGDSKLGVPPLKWVYGDHTGNIERMIDVSLDSLENGSPGAKDDTRYDQSTGDFTDKGGKVVPRKSAMGRDMATYRAGIDKAQAGWRTYARSAFLRSFLGANGRAEGSGILDRASSNVARISSTGVDGSAYPQTERIFYSRSADGLNEPDIRFGRSIGETLSTAANSVRDVKLPAGYLVSDLINAAPGKLGWWHKSVGTQYNLAQRSKPFKRVYDAVQTFMNDVSHFATEAADLAPNILPKLETWRDIGKSPLSADDTKALSAPVFEGTLNWARDESGKAVKMEVLEAAAAKLTPDQKAQRLLRNNHLSQQVLTMWKGMPLDQYESMVNGKYERDMLKAGIVFTDAELKQQFSLTDPQIALYREFRAATDKSLSSLAIADMLRFGGDDVAPIRDVVQGSKTMKEASETLRDYLLSLAESDPERNDVLIDTANKMIEKGDKAQGLIDRGYAPLSRFGHYTLDVVSESGERVYFSLFESKMEAARMRRKMEGLYPGAQITQGTVSEEAYKMFAGVSPETLELFGDMLGLEAQGDSASAQAFQEYLKLAKSNRSAMKRLVQRQGIAGFSEDAGRVLAGFVYSNARQASASLHMGEMTQAANDVPKTQGELKDAAVKLVDYIKNPQEEAQAFRSVLFAQYIGGSVASAMVNMTQPVTMTFPWLSQYGGIAKAAKQMTSAVKDSGKRKTGDAKLDAALLRAEEDGTVSPQEVHQLMQQSMGKATLRSGDGTRAGDAMATAQNSLSRVSLAWGKLFGAAEQFNRRVTFIAAYRTAIAEGINDPEGFARKAIMETQGVYNKGNKPRWARGAVGSILFTFKQYSISYVELLSRMAKSGPEGKKAALLALGVLFLTAGAGGLPGADDLDDIISGAMQSMGYNFDSKQKRQEFFVELFGEGGALFMERGISGLPGVPVDLSGRMGLGNLIPATGLFTKKPDHSRDLAEIAGPAGDLVKRGYEATGKLLSGDVLGKNGAIATASPVAARNLFQAFDMANMGMYRDAKGMKVLDTDAGDAMVKALGFQPTDVALRQDASFDVQRMIGVNRMRETEIANSWALGIFEKNPEKVQAAREKLREWNETNPESPIRINFRQIQQRVKNMNQTKAERIARTAPKEIKADVRRELDLQ